MQINRIPKHAPGYTILDNGHVVRKHSLSWAARGLLGYLLSLPNGAREDVRTLAAKSVEGRATVARALRELETAGHYVRRTVRDPVTGRVRTVVSVHEVPLADKAVHALPPVPVTPAAGPSGAGKAGSPSLRVRTVRRKEPSVLPVTTVPRMTEGMDLLLELGCREPALALAGKPLADQAARVEGLLAGGWSADALMGILAAPLPGKVTHSVAAILGGRLTKVPPVPSGRGTAVKPVTVPRPRRHECAGRDGMCGRPVGGAGEPCSGCRPPRAVGGRTVSRTSL
ncbi:helix-turn-helix domain-containing protein [Kitasatospora purpeofusca]|uniref:helix-turn-helix domain-containing protein n=1 Tax=Kitasatospora purpeofusca TaxID=67352 RepID=UPI0022593F04|nr:helix-turn-helix domain-containing protein [Kitasatospora purpeofusca]MCX4685312.1 helix-turn-helix domain-containing protein [Kitasatospora purpeofusca]